jgi:hypothetical protein
MCDLGNAGERVVQGTGQRRDASDGGTGRSSVEVEHSLELANDFERKFRQLSWWHVSQLGTTAGGSPRAFKPVRTRRARTVPLARSSTLSFAPCGLSFVVRACSVDFVMIDLRWKEWFANAKPIPSMARSAAKRSRARVI